MIKKEELEKLADVMAEGFVAITRASIDMGVPAHIAIRELLTCAAMHHIVNFKNSEEDFLKVAQACWRVMNDTRPGSDAWKAERDKEN